MKGHSETKSISFGPLQRIRKAFPYALLALALLTSNLITRPVATASAAPSLLKVITFEDGSLTHPISGADNVIGTVVLDAASSMKGVYSADIPNIASGYLQEDFTGGDDVYVSFYMKVKALPSDDVRFALLMDSGKNVGNLVLTKSGALRLRNDKAVIGTDTAPLTVGALYHVSLHQKQGTGGDAILEAYLTEGDALFGVPFASTTTGSWTSQATRLRLGALSPYSIPLAAMFDNIQLDSMAPSESPQPSPTPTATDIGVSPSATPVIPTATPSAPTPTLPAPTATRQPPTPTLPAPTPTQVVASSPGRDRVNCTGYPEPRVFLESQAGWITTPGRNGTNYGHVSVGTCFPYKQLIRGTLEFDIRVIMYENPGRLGGVHGGFVDAGIGTGELNSRGGQTCSDICTFWFHVSIDTTKAASDGRKELRIHAHVQEPDGKGLLVTTGWQVTLANGGRPIINYRGSDVTIARGWYTNVEYINASLGSDLPLQPLSGIWVFNASLKPGAGGIPVTYHQVILDADFNAEDVPGTVLKEGPKEWSGTMTLDTRTLANGPHHLILKTDANASTGSTISGVLVIPFTVQNP